VSPAGTYSGSSKGRALSCAVAFALLAAALSPAPAAAAPNADFDWTPTKPVPGQTVTFTADQSPPNVSWGWDLNNDGDFNDKTGPVVTHSYGAAGKFAVAVRAFDDTGAFEDRKRTIEVVSGSNKSPDASFVVFPSAPTAGLPVTLVSTSVDPDSPIPTGALRWDLNGDGKFDEAIGPSVTLTFPAPGLYPVALQVSTNAKDVASLVLPVSPPAAGAVVRAFSLMSPFPIVRIVGRASRRGARIRRLTVNAPPGSSVSVRCSGRGCPFKTAKQTVSMRATAQGLPASRITRVRRLEGRTLRAGAQLKVFVTRSDAIGKYTRFRIRKRKSPARLDLCMVPGSTRPGSCPTR
jgi:PKD repeat protein